MIFGYIIVGFVLILMVGCSLAPFFKPYNSSLNGFDDDFADSLIAAYPRLHKACMCSCPHCDSKSLRPHRYEEDSFILKCTECNRSWHMDYVLSFERDDED
jgi:transposase-like protein